MPPILPSPWYHFGDFGYPGSLTFGWLCPPRALQGSTLVPSSEPGFHSSCRGASPSLSSKHLEFPMILLPPLRRAETKETPILRF
jgi:hypothetical protein